MQRTVQREGEEVGDIDQRRNRPQPDRLQPGLQPFGRRTVLNATNDPTREMRAALRLQRLINLHRDGRGKAARHRPNLQRFQRAKPARRKIAGHAAHAQRVGAVRGDLDMDHRVHRAGAVRRQPVSELLPDLARGQFDDAVMLVRQFQLALRGHHAMAFHAADLAHAQRHVDAWHIIARLAQNHGDPGACIGGAADDLLFALIGQHPADAQPVGIRMWLGVQHFGQRKGGQTRGRVHHLFHLKPEVGQGIEDVVKRGRSLKVILQPGQGEFHRSGPCGSCRVAPGNGQRRD